MVRLYIFNGAADYPVANDNFGGDGKRAPVRSWEYEL